jgi:glycolate oxidase
MHPIMITDIRNKEEWERCENAASDIFELAISLNGTLSGEHGIGLAKKTHLPLAMNEATTDFMAKIKHAIDPAGILNPGKFV